MKVTILFLACTLSISIAQTCVSVSDANNKFSTYMYQELAKTPGNVFFSPISVHALFSLVAQGAAGETLNEITKVLRLDQNSAAVGYQNFMQTLNHLQLDLHMANKIYSQKNIEMKQTFKNVASRMFFAEAESIDFADGQNAALNINKWVMENTNNKIKDIVKPEDISAQTRMVLLNAIYFKGNWLYKFDTADTRNAPFHEDATTAFNVAMMSMTDNFNYTVNRELNAEILEMKYQYKNASMIFILPKSTETMGELEKKLVNFNLSTITEGMTEMHMDVYIPKFKIETTILLNSVLQQMGIRRAFGPADFSQLLETPESLYIDKAIQKAFIVVNEEGSEASAASLVQVRPVSLLPEFRANRPFMVIIQVKAGQVPTTLFLGKIVHPEYK